MWSLLDLQNSSEAFLVVEGCLSLSCIFSIELLQPHLQLLLCLLRVVSLLAHLDVLLPELLLVSNELIAFCLLDLDLEFQQLVVLFEVMQRGLAACRKVILDLAELALLQLLRCNKLAMHASQHRVFLLHELFHLDEHHFVFFQSVIVLVGQSRELC